MSYIHVLYPIHAAEEGVVYQCGSCERKIVILACGEKVVMNEGQECTHELVEPIESYDFPPEFKELFLIKGWE